MGNIHALNCYRNPASLTKSDRPAGASSGYSTPSKRNPPAASFAPKSLHGDKIHQLSVNGVQHMSTGYSSERVFLSHSGKQKDFAEQLWVDLTAANISCFFDKHSLLKGKEFPRRIFDAAEKCKVAVVVLSQDFIISKWPMQELCAFVEAREATNRNLQIFPLYFKMTPEELGQQIENIRRDGIPADWKYIRNSKRERIGIAACLRALETLRRMNGRRYDEMEGEVAYRSQIVRDIRSLLPPKIKHEDPSVRGRERLCQEVAKMFDRVPYYMNGVKVAGLYGIDGSGKTTLCKSLCDFYSDRFEELRAFHAEFESGGLPIESLKRLPMILTDTDETAVKFVNGYEESVAILKQRISSQRVFLALDNIPDRLKSIKEVQAYVNVGFADGSLILLTARTRAVLDKIIPLENQDRFMHVPSLTEEEAIDVLLHPISRKACELTDKQRYIAKECAELCRFGLGMSCGQGNYHPLALTAFGFYLCKDFTCNFSHWLQIPDQFREYVSKNFVQENPFCILERCFNTRDPKYLRIFMLLTFYAPHFELTGNYDYFSAVLKYLAEVSTPLDHQFMSDAIRELKEKDLIEGCGRDRSFFHRLRMELESNQLKEMEEWMSMAGENNIPILTRSIVEAIKVEDCKMIRRVNLSDCPCPNLRSLTLRRNECLSEVEGLNGLLDLENLHLEEMSNVEELPSFQGLINLRHVTLCKMSNLKERPDLSNCLHLETQKICIRDCEWQNESQS